MATEQKQRRVQMRQLVAATGAVAVFGSITVLGSTASAAATWPPTATITEDDDDRFDVVVNGAVLQNCGRQGAYVEVTIAPGSITGQEILPNGGEFTVEILDLIERPTAITAEVLGGTPQCPPAAQLLGDDDGDEVVLAAPAWTDDVLALTATQNATYTDAVAASGNPTPTYSKSAGDLPAGLTLDTTSGALTGTPTTLGDSTFTLTATNSEGSVDKQFTISVVEALAAPAWTDSVLGSGLKVGTAFTDGVAATGKPTPTYSVFSGSLPAGLTLNTATGALTGTPSATGTFPFTLRASNSEGSVDAPLSLTVAAASVIDDGSTKTPTPKTPTPKTPTPKTPTPKTPAETTVDPTDPTVPTETAAPSAPVVTPPTEATPLPVQATSDAARRTTEVRDAVVRRGSGATALAATGSGAGVLAAAGSGLLAVGICLALAGRRRTHRATPAPVVVVDERAGGVSAPWGALILSLGLVLVIGGRRRSA